MRKAVKIILIVLGVVVIGVGIVMSVFMFRYARLNTADFGPGSMMGNDRWNTNDFGPGSMMGNDDRDDDRHNWMHNEFSSGLFGRMNDRMSRDFNDDCGTLIAWAAAHPTHLPNAGVLLPACTGWTIFHPAACIIRIP